MARRKQERAYFDAVLYIAPRPAEAGGISQPADLPPGTVYVGEIIENNDFTSDEDWERLVFNMGLAVQRRIRQRGWPGAGADFDTPPGEAEERATPSVEPEPEASAEPDLSQDGTRCWNCGSNLVQTGSRGAICPNGCAGKPIPTVEQTIEETPDAEPEPTGLQTYASTPESPKPTSFPQSGEGPTD